MKLEDMKVSQKETAQTSHAGSYGNFRLDKKLLNRRSGFTLAEMMVVMLILSIILAAFAPVITTRTKSDYSSPWHYSPSNTSDAYYGTGSSMIAMIGQNSASDAERDTKLIINTGGASSSSHILFKSSSGELGRLRFFSDGSFVLGSGLENNTGSYNTAIGTDALSNNTSGSNNTAVGYQALHSNQQVSTSTDACDNTAVGYQALHSNRAGIGNTALGSGALSGNTSGSDNTAVGTGALSSNTAGDNTALGYKALNSLTGSYYDNTAVGSGALQRATSGSNNTALGYQAMYNTTAAGSDNIANGYMALYNNTGSNNIANGHMALYSNTGNDNIALGYLALKNNTSGSNNIANGNNALNSNTKGDNNIANGYWALKNNTTGSNNIANGNSALYSNTTGDNNIANGYYALSSNTTGSNNIANGNNALNSNTNGSSNHAIGFQALQKNTTGSFNIANGYMALNSNTNGSSNHAIGYQALLQNTTGGYNVAIGNMALSQNTTGSNNTAIGINACRYVKGSNKTCIGTGSGPESGSDWASSSDDVERIFIGGKSKFNDGPAVLEVHNDTTTRYIRGGRGDTTSAVVINGTLIVKGGIVYSSPWAKDEGWKSHGGRVNLIGNTDQQLERITPDTGSNYIYTYYRDFGDFLNPYDGSSLGVSDRRLKYVGKESTSGLDKIRQLKVFNYTFKKDEKKEPHVGVIAQDLQKIFPDAVKKGADGFLNIRMEDMFYAVINAIKELDSRLTALEKENKELKSRIEKLEAKLK